MGAFCSCLAPDNESSKYDHNQGASSRTPLLSGAKSHSNGGRSGSLGPTSARKFHQPRGSEPGVISEELHPIKVKPTGVREVDKQLQDHAKLYNDILEKRNALSYTMLEFHDDVKGENSGSGTKMSLEECFKELKDRLGDKEIQVKRKTQYCMEIVFDAKNVPYNVIAGFQSFNKANKLVKEILPKIPSSVKSIQLVVGEEEQLRREIMLASLGAELGPDALKNCLDTIRELRQVPNIMELIKKETIKKFDILKNGAEILLNETNV